MSIRAPNRRVGSAVKSYGSLRKASTAKTARTVFAYICSYLDKTTSAEAKVALTQEGFAAVEDGLSSPHRAGADCISRGEKWKIRAYGFLRDDVTRLGGQVAHLQTNDHRVRSCHRAWMSRLKEHPKAVDFAHRYVVSLTPKFCELMEAVGKDCDALLVEVSRCIMRRFQEKHYPEDRLGYLVGIHHNRKHIHAHILLFPYTENGVHLRVTDSGDDKRFGELRKIVDKHIRNSFLREFDNPIRASERFTDKVAQSRMVSFHAVLTVPKNQMDWEQEMQWIALERKRLLALTDAELREVLLKRYDGIIDHYRSLMARFRADSKAYEEHLQRLSTWEVGQKAALKNNQEAMLKVKRRLAVARKEVVQSQKALATFRFYPGSPSGTLCAAYEAESADQRRWLANLFADPASAAHARSSLGQQPLVKLIGELYDRDRLTDAIRQVRTSRGLLRRAFSIRVDEVKENEEKLRAQMGRLHLQRQGIQVRLDSLKLLRMIATGASKNRKPLFLEQFEGMKRTGMEVPVLCRHVSPDEMTKREVDQTFYSFDDPNMKNLHTLRALQGKHTKEDVLEAYRYWRNITDATTTRNKAMQREAAEAEMKKTLETQSVQEFLLSQNIRHAGEDQEKPTTERTVQKMRQQPDFDL